MFLKKDQPDKPTMSVSEAADVADENPPSVVAVDDVSNEQPIEATVPNDGPPPSSSRVILSIEGPPAGMEIVTDDGCQQKDQPSSSRRRKTREEKDREKGDKRRPETIFDAPPVPRPCAVCGRQFLNYKALFGHMRSHPGREWRGAFPPPVSAHPPLAETMLKITEDLLRSDSAGLPPGNASEGMGPRLEIDLNREPPVASPGNDEAVHGGIDLNRDASGESSSSDNDA